jgi:GPH family glycoside/pentoside/hexuronide:cation symporter
MKLAFWQKFLYSSGSLGTALSLVAFNTYIQFYYVDKLGLRAEWFGIAWLIYGVWNAINDPLAGFLSDNTKTRWGRRIPWIAAAFLPLGISFYFLWTPPASLVAAGGFSLFLYFMAIVLIFDTLWTFAVMNWTTLFPEMISDEKERAGVSGLRQAFTVVGLLVGGTFRILVGEDWSGITGMALLFGALTSLTLGLSLLGSKEQPGVQQEKQPPLLPALRATFRNLSFRWFLVPSLSKEFIVSILAAAIPFWTKYVLVLRAPVTVFGTALDPGIQESLLLASIFLLTLPGIPFWTWVARRFSARRGWQISQATFALSLLTVYAASDFSTALIGTSLVGLSFAGLLVYPDLLLADVIDEDETVVGARREGMYFGINGFMIRFGVTLQGLTTSAILLTSGYVANPAADAAQPASAVFGIRAMITLIPMLASLVAILGLQVYPLHGGKLQTMRARSKKLRAS